MAYKEFISGLQKKLGEKKQEQGGGHVPERDYLYGAV